MVSKALGNEPLPFGMYKIKPDAWQTKVQASFHIPFPLPWLIIASGLFAVGLAIGLYKGESENVIRFLAMECAVIAALTNAVVFFEMLTDGLAATFPLLLKEDREQAKRWVSQWYEKIYWSKNNIYVGLIFGLIILLASWYNIQNLSVSIVTQIYCLIVTFIMGFAVGSALWVMINIARMFASLGRDVQIYTSIFDTKTSVLRIASSFLWKISLVASLIYMLGLSTIYFCSLESDAFSLIVIICFGCFLVFYFVVPQLNIHRVLVDLKRSRLKMLVDQIDNTFDIVAAKPTPENIAKLRELFHLQGVVNGKRAWSFGIGELLMLISSIVIPLLLFFFKVYLGPKN